MKLFPKVGIGEVLPWGFSYHYIDNESYGWRAATLIVTFAAKKWNVAFKFTRWKEFPGSELKRFV